MKPVGFTEEAEADAREASAFYAGRSPGLEGEFTAELDRVLALLAENPEIGVPVSGGLRRLLLRRFPYYLLYRVEEDVILVLAVGHHSRRPGYWRDRL
ncbi:MAG TPA: type II toxin-antitoxin system RelE/ParE family toxin [Longimicrobiaceae bacterium]|nr:type II toxin-antitoxin system RelE/ParE family toxin [Longimicrobiaceae bacterium]